MKLIGAAVNCGAVFLGSLLGLLFKKGIPERVQKSLNYALSLCVLYIGIKGSLKGENTLIAALSLAIGTIIGELIDIDRHLNKFGDFLQKKLSRNTENSSFGEGFVNATLFTCVGAMAIVGAIEAGMQGSFSTYYAKALLDCFFVMIMTTTFGIGCFFSGIIVFVYEAILTLGAGFLSSFLSDSMINEMSCVGSVLIIAIAPQHNEGHKNKGCKPAAVGVYAALTVPFYSLTFTFFMLYYMWLYMIFWGNCN